MLQVDFTPALAAVQFLGIRDQSRLNRMIERRAARNPRFAAKLALAKEEARKDEMAYDEWLCSQAPALEDLPW